MALNLRNEFPIRIERMDASRLRVHLPELGTTSHTGRITATGKYTVVYDPQASGQRSFRANLNLGDSIKVVPQRHLCFADKNIQKEFLAIFSLQIPE